MKCWCSYMINTDSVSYYDPYCVGIVGCVGSVGAGCVGDGSVDAGGFDVGGVDEGVVPPHSAGLTPL